MDPTGLNIAIFVIVCLVALGVAHRGDLRARARYARHLKADAEKASHPLPRE